MEPRRDAVHRDDGDVKTARLKLIKRWTPRSLRLLLPRSGKELANPNVDTRRRILDRIQQARQEHGRDAVGRTDQKATSRRRWRERRDAGEHASHARQDVSHGVRQFERPRRGHDALWRTQKQWVSEQLSKPSETVAHRGWRQVHSVGGAAHVALCEYGLEEDERLRSTRAR